MRSRVLRTAGALAVLIGDYDEATFLRAEARDLTLHGDAPWLEGAARWKLAACDLFAGRLSASGNANHLLADPLEPELDDVQQQAAPRLGLTRREHDILPYLVAGLSDREIASNLFISHRTASSLVGKIMQRLGASSRADAAVTPPSRGGSHRSLVAAAPDGYHLRSASRDLEGYRVTESSFPYDLIIFDLDGTLTDSKVGITRSVQHALAHFGIAVDNLDDLTHFIGPPLRDSFIEAFGFDDEQILTATRVYRERYGAVGLLENEVFPRTSNLLQAANETGATLAVASTKGEPYVHRILEYFGLDHHFAVMGGADHDRSIHTKADVITRVLAELPGPLNPTRTIMIGDREHDVFGARHHGIETISVRYGYARPGELEAAKPCAIAETMEDLAALLGLKLAPVST